MTDDRKSAAALIAGMTASIITMAFHPSGGSPEHFESIARLNVVVHSLALLFLPVLFLGALGLTQRLSAPNRLSLSALVFYGFAEVAITIAATASGLLYTGLMHHLHTADPAMRDTWNAALQLAAHLNQSFALVFVVAASIAIVLWSAAILKSRVMAHALGIYGCILGPLTILAVLSGHIKLNVHGFGAIILGQAIWFFAAGIQLWRMKNIDSPISA